MSKAQKIAKLPDQITSSADFKNLVDLFAVLSEATDRRNEIQVELNRESRELVDANRKEIVEIETKIADAEEAIRILAERHPEWFKGKKSLSTAYGKCGFRKVSELVAPSKDLSIRLIRAAGRAEDFVRVEESLDLEALEKLSDEELTRFGISRRVENSFSVKPGKVDLGKAAATSADEAQAAA